MRAWLCCRSSAFDSDFRTQMYFFSSRCSMQTFISVDQPKCVWQWCNGDGRSSRSRSRNRDPARRRPLSGRGSPPQSGGWPHPRSGSPPRGGGGGGGSDRPCEASLRRRERCSGPVDWRQPRRDGGSGARRADDGSPPRSRDLRPDRLPSEDRRPPARADAHRGGGRGGGGGGGHHGGGYCGDRGGGGGGYGREDEGSGAGPTPCWLPHKHRQRR